MAQEEATENTREEIEPEEFTPEEIEPEEPAETPDVPAMTGVPVTCWDCGVSNQPDVMARSLGRVLCSRCCAEYPGRKWMRQNFANAEETGIVTTDTTSIGGNDDAETENGGGQATET